MNAGATKTKTAEDIAKAATQARADELCRQLQEDSRKAALAEEAAADKDIPDEADGDAAMS